MPNNNVTTLWNGSEQMTGQDAANTADAIIYHTSGGGVSTVQQAIDALAGGSTADNVSYDNTTSGLAATDVQGAVDEVAADVATLNDNLNGFKFYPTGTGIVGLIADDSAYMDANGKYVIWGTATAEQLVADNPNTYKSVPSEEDCRGKVGADTATPFKGGEFNITFMKMDGTYYPSSQGYNSVNLLFNVYNDNTLPITNAIYLTSANTGKHDIGSDIVYSYSTLSNGAVHNQIKANVSGKFKIWDSITGQSVEGNYNKDDVLFTFNGSYQTITVIKL